MKRTLKAKKLKSQLKGIAFVAATIALIALAGGLEQNMLSVSQYIGFSAVSLAILAVLVKSVKV